MRKLLCVLFALPLLTPAQEPLPTLRTTASEVLLDFVVRDKHGYIIRNLRPDEVQVFENRVPQPIRHFEFMGGKLTVEPVAPATKTVPTATTSAQPAHLDVNELRDISMVTVVIANMDPRGRDLAKGAMEAFIQNELRPNTYVGVFRLGMGGLRMVQNYTNEGAKISAAVTQTLRRVNTDQPVNGELFRPQIGMGMGNDPNDVNSSMVSVPVSSTPDPIQLIETGSQTAISNAMNQAVELMMGTEYANEMQDAYSDSMRYLTSIRMLVEAQKSIPGRKVLLLFSAGMPASHNSLEFLHYVIGAANRANVSIYAVDTRGLTSQSDLDASRRMLTEAAAASQKQFFAAGDAMITPEEANAEDVADASMHTDMRENLYELVSGTGGDLLPDSLDLREPLRRVMEDVRTHYEVAYSPSNPATDGTFRKIEVKVSRPGAKVFAREGYYAVPSLNGHQVFPFEVATLKAINTRPLLHQFNFHAAALQFRPGTAQTQLSFVFQAPASDLTIVKEGKWVKVHVDVTVLIKDEQGQVASKISKDIPYREPAAMIDELKKGVVSFTTPFFLPPGHYTLETAAVDRLSMKASVSRTALVVNQDSGLSMSDVEVARRVDPIYGPMNPSEPLQAHGGLVTPELSDTVQPDAEGKVTLYAVAYPEAPIDAPVNATLELWRDGHLLMQSPTSDVPPDATGAASILASLKTEKLSPGQYQAQVSFQYKGQKVVKMIAFTLAGAS